MLNSQSFPENPKVMEIIIFDIPSWLTQGWNAQFDFFAKSKLIDLNKECADKIHCS